MEDRTMANVVAGVVANGVVIPASPLPEGAQVEVSVKSEPPSAEPKKYLTASELRKLPPAEREPYLATAAALAEKDYLEDKELTGFDAFSEELDDDDDHDEG
jgi:hypothetical protein